MPNADVANHAIKKAARVSSGSWRPYWRYDESKEDVVWNVLDPVRTYIKEQTGQTMLRSGSATCGELIAQAEHAILEVKLKAGSKVPLATP